MRIYEISKSFPVFEKYGLTSQILRAVVSVPTNIAEGCNTASDKEFRRYVNISLASNGELSYLIFLAKELNYINSINYDELKIKMEVISKMLNNLKKALTN